MTQDRLALVLLPFAVLAALGAQDCGDFGRGPDAPQFYGELGRRLEEFLRETALLPAKIVPPPGWVRPEDGSTIPGPEAQAVGFSIRGSDRRGMNPEGLPAVVEIFKMEGTGQGAVAGEQVAQAVVGSDYAWQARVPLQRGENILGARARVGQQISEFTVIRVVSQSGRPGPSAFDYPVGAPDVDGRRSGSGWYVAQDFADRVCHVPGRLGQHLGEDWNKIGGGDRDEPVFSIARGDVIAVGPNRGYGHYVMIRHTLPPGYGLEFVVSLYGHLGSEGLARMGTIDRGAPIGRVGRQGDNGVDRQGSPWPEHLHFELRSPQTGRAADWMGGGYLHASEQQGFLNPTDATNRGQPCGPGTATTAPGSGWIDQRR